MKRNLIKLRWYLLRNYIIVPNNLTEAIYFIDSSVSEEEIKEFNLEYVFFDKKRNLFGLCILTF